MLIGEACDLGPLLITDLIPLIAQALPHLLVEARTINKLYFSLTVRRFAVSQNPYISANTRIVE